MKTSNLSPKKLSHRSRNRTPKLYRWADIGTEALIYFTIVFGPWAFGTVHDWAITTMNLANYGIGLLLLAKWVIRWKTDYQPARWTAQSKNGEENTPLKQDWRTKTIGFLTLYMLGYILVSILNARSTYNWDFNFFEYEETYIKWLPHTYDKAATIQSFCNFLGLACCFWGVRDWLLGKTRTERMEVKSEEGHSEHMFLQEISVHPIPIRLKRLLWLICVSGGLLALIGIVQRLDGTPKLLWMLERETYNAPTQSFGPFGYRGNGASYINMVLPMCIGFLILLIRGAKAESLKSGNKIGQSFLILLPIIILMITAPFMSLSRGGFAVLTFLLFANSTYMIVCRFTFINRRQKISLAILFILGIGMAYLVGWKQIKDRFQQQTEWHETQIKKPNLSERITFVCDLPPAPYENDHTLFMVTDSRDKRFRASLFQGVLTKNGFLRLLLHSYRQNSSIEITYTELSNVLKKKSLELEITRNIEGINATANQMLLKGKMVYLGDSTTKYTHPVIPNEIMVYKKSHLQTQQLDIQSRLFEIEPIAVESMNIQNNESIRLDMEHSWNPLKKIMLMSSRNRIYEDSWRMAKDFSWLGCGSGGWATVYFLYHDADEPWDAWVHCDWLEYWINFGLLGTAPGFMLFALTLIPIRSELSVGIKSHSCLHAALNFAFVGCLLHAIFDFPLQVLSITHLFIIFCAIKITLKKENMTSTTLKILHAKTDRT